MAGTPSICSAAATWSYTTACVPDDRELGLGHRTVKVYAVGVPARTASSRSPTNGDLAERRKVYSSMPWASAGVYVQAPRSSLVVRPDLA